jgi:hypothetical protein
MCWYRCRSLTVVRRSVRVCGDFPGDYQFELRRSDVTSLSVPASAGRPETFAVLINRDEFPRHVPWIVGCLAVAVLSAVWYGAAYLGSGGWNFRPGGSQPAGFTFGVVGGLICLFEFLLWPRKQRRAWRLGRVQVWMRAHIWLGLLAVPLLVLHTGFRWGGLLSTVLMILFLLVIASGVWGLVVQQFLPSRMFERVPAETIFSQIDHVLAQLLREGDQLVTATCGSEPGEHEAPETDDEAFTEVASAHRVVGAVRTAGRVQGKVLETRSALAFVPDAEFLRAFYRDTVKPYLLDTAQADSALRVGSRAAILFQDTRTRLPQPAHAALAALEGICDQRRQLYDQARIHFWLHNWLWVHLPLSIALIVLMFVHVFYALKY